MRFIYLDFCSLLFAIFSSESIWGTGRGKSARGDLWFLVKVPSPLEESSGWN